MSIEIPFEKLNKDSYGEESRKIIETWQKRAIELAEQDDFRQHPVTRRLAEEAKKTIEAINHLLSGDENLSETERKALFREKKVHTIYLNLFTYDPTSELQQIANEVNNELN